MGLFEDHQFSDSQECSFHHFYLFIYFNLEKSLTTSLTPDLQEKEVRKWKEELLDQRRRMMEEKLLHAEFKRELQLQAIVKKAQEEEAKVRISQDF